MQILYDTIHLELLADPNTDPRLLPAHMADRDNSRRVRHYRAALHKAYRQCLSPEQQEQLRLHYQAGLRKSEIARRQNSSCSAVCKSIKAGECALRSYVQQYMEIYEVLEREFSQEYE